ncbi:MAG TPA: ELWxxDGT repeat protein, partial [Phnomibacter sp.]|nr:ELWxxDGT repeat protein [Phnomibacter sp.]
MNTQDLTKRLMRRFTLLAGVGMMALQLQAQTFNILKEINTTATLGSISNTGMATVGDKVLFFSDDGINGQELWRTDGTPAGTQRLTDILPGAFPGIGASPQWAVGDGVFYFAASDASELWRSDGTEEGTYLLKFFGGTNRVSQMFFHNGVLYLVANDGINGSEPWISDGTPAGTVLLKDINPGSANSLSTTVSPYGFIAMGSNVYFAANNGANGRELWKTDGTTSGTILVKDVFSGTQGGINNMKAAAHNGKIYFAATNGTSGTELWATDGTDAGTYQVKDINPGSGSASPNNLITFNGSLFFSASNSNNNTPGLWKSDGTDAGTVLVKDLAADGVSLTVGFNNATNFFTVNGSKLYFRGGLATGSGLFASDGTTAGTGLVKAVGGTGGFFSFNGLLFFQGSGPESSNFPLLYKSDGTAGGTVPVFEGNLLSGLSVVVPQNLPILNDQLFFVGDSPENGPELWSTDGTNAGTKLIRDINLSRSGTSTSSQAIAGSASLNRLFLFTAGDEEHGVELWKTDGTTGGTALVKDIFPGKRSSSPSQFRTVGDQVFFMANNGITGNELWKTDGTEEGTRLVKDINPGIPDGFPIRLTVSGPYVYFIATHPDTGTEMWRSDGTEAGTTLVADLTPGSVSGFTLSNTHLSFVNKAFFINGITNKLYVADGNANTFAEFSPDIVAAYDMAVVGNALFIGGRNANGQNVLWRSNNGAAPVQYKVVRNTDGGNIGMYQFANCNGKLYFSANDGTTGSEPWVSDGTDAGTFRLKDIQTGSGSSQPAHFSASGNKVFFQARGTGTDAELWATDGTEVGTYLVKDINSGTIGSNPSSLLALPGGKILFTADNGIDGIELWQSDGNNAGTTLLRNFSSNGNGLSTASILLHFKENYVLWPLNNGVLFFARSADKGNQLYYGSIAPQGYYVNDNSTTADIFTTAIGNDANTGTFHAPFATIQHAVNVVPEGSTIYVDAGSYTEQVTITKGLTIKGAGKGLTMVNGPEGTLTRLPDFGDEPAIIQSTQNIGEVIIEDLAIDGSLSSEQHSILIQGSGRVANCEMRNANNGIFFREVNGGECIAEAIGNHIHNIDYVGILFAGTGMDARAFSNTIDLNGAIFGMGFLAGYGGNGSIDKLIAENNFVIDHNGFGFSVNAASATINYNSITAISGGSI